MIHSEGDPVNIGGLDVREVQLTPTEKMWVVLRPGVFEFLAEMEQIYEIAIFTASLSQYADPIIDILDANGVGYW